MTKLYDIITDENDTLYAQTAEWCNNNNAFLEEIEPIEKEIEFINGQREEITVKQRVRQFKVLPVPEPTDNERKAYRIMELKQLLSDNDYKGQKYLDGEYTEAEWKEIVQQRKAWREEIRRLESELESA